MKDEGKIKDGCYNSRFFVLLPVCLFLFLNGCAGFISPARKHALEQNTAYWFDYDASRRGAFIIPSAQQIRICAEPSPDVALQFLDKFKLTVPVENIPVSGQVDISQQIVQLAGRSQAILFLREALYRLCEISISKNLTEEQILEIYKQIIEVSSKLAAAEYTEAEAKLTKEQTRLYEIRKDILMKVDRIVEYVNENGKVSEKKLSELIKGTSIEETFKKFYGKPIEEFRKQLEVRYYEYIDLLFEKIK